MSTHHSESAGPERRKVAGRKERGEREVVCKICQAVYLPAQTHKQLAHAPSAVIESAFMSMCHFCFRCRRPACPECWDELHGVCGACAADAHLPFRADVSPLEGTVFPPIPPSQSARVRTLTPPLVCVRPGQFQRAPLPIEAQTTLFMPSAHEQTIYDPGKKQPERNVPLASNLPPADMVARAAQAPRDFSSVPQSAPLRVRQGDIEDIATRPPSGKSGSPVLLEHGERRARPETNAYVGNTGNPGDHADLATQPGKKRLRQKGTRSRTRVSTWRGLILHILTEIILLLVLLIVITIIGALVFPTINDNIVSVLHIDIRAEVAYLLQLLQHLF